MYASEDTSDVVIPSVFVARAAYESILEEVQRENGPEPRHVFATQMERRSSRSREKRHPYASRGSIASPPPPVTGIDVLLLPNDFSTPLVEILLITVISPAAVMLALYLTWTYRDYVKRKNEVAPLEAVANLPVKIYVEPEVRDGEERRVDGTDGEGGEGGVEHGGASRGTGGRDVQTKCAICLEDFQNGDEVRILLCKHEFHVACVDRWLTKRKRTCPICKQDTCPTPPSDASSSPNPAASSSSTSQPAEDGDETTPLLMGTSTSRDEEEGKAEEEGKVDGGNEGPKEEV
ncbi:hypothetical protein HDV00_003275 [Rhizophlyctis rosea]|nr:hypothetical protein HDV00_003275 [Rhizophlyctis rosea]